MAVDKLVVECGQAVIYHHIQPLTKTPELEMEDPCIALGFLRIPLLLLPVWDDLQERRPMHPGLLRLTFIWELTQTISKTRKNMRGTG